MLELFLAGITVSQQINLVFIFKIPWIDAIQQQCKSHGSSSFRFCFRYVVHIQGIAELSLPHSWLELIACGKIEALHGSSKEVALVGAEGDEGSWKIPSLGADQMRRVQTVRRWSVQLILEMV